MGVNSAPWEEGPLSAQWPTPEITKKILGEDEAARGKPIPLEWAHICARRIREVRKKLEDAWFGLELPHINSHRVHWLLASLIARENLLLLGPPGVAKTEIAERTFQLLNLTTPKAHISPADLNVSADDFGAWWSKRVKQEKEQQKYFRYLLSRFTQPEELFGPIEISLLRKGILAHINFGFLTSPGVRAAFLDEVFKASSSILNSLLTLTQEREYFNLGGMVKSDMVMFIGASNELPGGLATGSYGVGSGGEDFNLLYAFLDRFPIRLAIPAATGTSTSKPEKSNLWKASEEAIRRESRRFLTGRAFQESDWSSPGPAPSINDALLLGRCCLEYDHLGRDGVFTSKAIENFKKAFFRIGGALQSQNTGANFQNMGSRINRITWTISPRKMKAIYKVALAHALIRDDGLAREPQLAAGPSERDLHVFEFIWDSPSEIENLVTQLNGNIEQFWTGQRDR